MHVKVAEFLFPLKFNTRFPGTELEQNPADGFCPWGGRGGAAGEESRKWPGHGCKQS